MADIEVHIDFAAGQKRVGTLHRHARRGGEAVSFEYHPDWLEDRACFSLEPALTLGRGAFVPASNYGSPLRSHSHGAPAFGRLSMSSCALPDAPLCFRAGSTARSIRACRS